MNRKSDRLGKTDRERDWETNRKSDRKRKKQKERQMGNTERKCEASK